MLWIASEFGHLWSQLWDCLGCFDSCGLLWLCCDLQFFVLFFLLFSMRSVHACFSRNTPHFQEIWVLPLCGFIVGYATNAIALKVNPGTMSFADTHRTMSLRGPPTPRFSTFLGYIQPNRAKKNRLLRHARAVPPTPERGTLA